MQKPNVELGSLARKREWDLLVYLSQPDTYYLEWESEKHEHDDPKFHSLSDLVSLGLVKRIDTNGRITYEITSEGKEFVRYYKSLRRTCYGHSNPKMR